MTIDDNHNEGRNGEMTFFHEESDDIKMNGYESSDGLYEATIKVCTANVNNVTDKKCRPWHERLGHCST